jgi:hypothetical protein
MQKRALQFTVKEGKKIVQMQSLLFAVNKNMISYPEVFLAIPCKESRTINSASHNVIHSTKGKSVHVRFM